MSRCGLALLLLVLSVLATAQPEGRQLPTRLITEADFIHQGSFTIPDMVDLGVPWANGGAPNWCQYTQGVIAFNPARNSLFLVCHVHSQTVAEISIPAIGGVATQLQAPREPTEGGIDNELQPVGAPAGSKQIGGMQVIGGRLVVTAFVYYDAAPQWQAIKAGFSRPLNLSQTGDVRGAFDIGSISVAFYAGYMSPIPTAWQSLLGGDLLLGQCCLGIISRTSYGPSVSAVTAANLAAGLDPTPAQHLVGYPEPNVLAAWNSTGPLFNGTTNMRGVLLPDGTASVVFFGYHGMGTFVYAGGTTAPPYEPHLWFYNANDLAAVRSGAKQWYEPRPYRTARLPGLTEANIGGVALDPATGRIFVAENYGDGVKPRIHVFSISGTPTTPPPQPPADSDGDGVPDSVDQCPTQAGPAPTGCPTPPPSGPDTTPPSLKFTVSATSIALGQSVAFTLAADDPSGLRSMGVVDKSNNDLAVTPTPWPFPPSSPTSETRTWTPSSEGTYPIRAWVRDNSAARNEASATATITVLAAPPPQPSPDPIYTVSTLAPTSCTFVVNASAKPPALTGVNIGVQFQRSPDQATWTNHGSRDNAAPYERSASLANRTWFFRAIWSSSTTTLPAVTAGRKDGCAP